MSQSQRSAVLSPDQKFQQRVFVVKLALAQGTQSAAIRSGISARTVRSWKERFRAHGVPGLRDRSRAARRVHNRKDSNGEAAQALRELNEKEPGLTRLEQMSRLFIDYEGVTLSWVSRTRQRLGLTTRIKKLRPEHKLRYEKPLPGYLQIDTKYVEKQGEPGKFIYQFTAIDECTRVRFLGAAASCSAMAAVKFLGRAVDFYAALGVPVIQVQTDRGVEFTLPQNARTMNAYVRGDAEEAQFTKACAARRIRHRLIKPRQPELNGKVERSHRIDEERFYSRFTFATAEDLEHALQTVWMPEYNERRPHGALQGLSPLEFLKQKLKNAEISTAA